MAKKIAKKSAETIKKKISKLEFDQIKNIIDDNQKIYNIQKSVTIISEEVEFLLVKLGNLLQNLHQIHIDVNKIQSRIDEKFELLNDKFDMFLDEIVKNNDLNIIENIFQQEKFQDRIMEKVISKEKN